MGSVVGAAIGALLIGLAEQFGLAYAPTYSVVFTFVIMVVALAFRPRGHHGEERDERGAVAAGDELGGAGAPRRRSRRVLRSSPRSAPSPAPRSDATPAPSLAARASSRDPAAPRRRPRRACVAYPFVASPFFTYQIGAQSLALGLIALSLTFLGGYGGMVSLAQMTVAGLAGYLVAIFGTSSIAAISLGWPWWLAVVVRARAARPLFAAAVGWLSVRTEGIYTIMITLAIGVAFFYLAQQNYTVFNGFQGFSKIARAERLRHRLAASRCRSTSSRSACALAGYFFVKHLVRAPFGVALQGIRDNPRRMACARLSTSPRTASPPTRSPACSPRSAAC